MTSPRRPDCEAYPLKTFPVDSQGDINALNQTVTIPLDQVSGYAVEAAFVARPVTGKALDILRQQVPNASCVVDEAVTIFTALGPTTQPRVITDNCGVCGHRVTCEYRRTTP